MGKRPCLDCGALSTGSRCPIHQAVRDNERYSRRTRQRPHAERMRRARVVAQHRAEHGDLCPGWKRPPHPSADLTADHVIPVAAGGNEQGQLAVLCRPCNSSKKATLG